MQKLSLDSGRGVTLYDDVDLVEADFEAMEQPLRHLEVFNEVSSIANLLCNVFSSTIEVLNIQNFPTCPMQKLETLTIPPRRWCSVEQIQGMASAWPCLKNLEINLAISENEFCYISRQCESLRCVKISQLGSISDDSLQSFTLRNRFLQSIEIQLLQDSSNLSLESKPLNYENQLYI